MKKLALLLAVLFGVMAQSPAPAVGVVHLVYQFGYNVRVETGGQGTGTTAIDISGPAPDGGLLVTGADHWWNTVRPRAANTCEVYPTGAVTCGTRPYAISPIQITLFPLLGHSYFHGLGTAGTGSWKRSYDIKAAIVPGASGPPSNQYTWSVNASLNGTGPIKNTNGMIMVKSTATIDQQGGHYRQATSNAQIVWDPTVHLPVIVHEVRTHLPQQTVYNKDLIELKIQPSESE